jgi:hypothetical protein
MAHDLDGSARPISERRIRQIHSNPVWAQQDRITHICESLGLRS